MRRAIVFLLAFAAGCGGEPFQAAVDLRVEDAGSAEDSAPAHDDAARGGEPQPEAGESDAESTADAGVEANGGGDDDASDAGAETCVPHPIDAGPCFGSLVTSATFPAWVSLHDAGATCAGSFGWPTPEACLCDYTCTCLSVESQDVCDSNGGWASCTDVDGIPYVSCAK